MELETMTEAEKTEIITNFKRCQSEAQNLWGDIHREYNADMDFIMLGNQSTVSEQQARMGRPMIIVNKLVQFVKKVTNEMAGTNMVADIIPVDNGADKDKAKIRKGIIRGIERQSIASSAYNWAAECQVTGSIGAWRIGTKYVSDTSFDQTITIDRILDPTSVFYGPSKKVDFSDAKYCIVAGKATALGEESTGKAYLKDNPNETMWGDAEKPNEFEFWCMKETKDTLYIFKDGTKILKSKVSKDADPSVFTLDKNGKRLSRPTIIKKWKVYRIKAGEVEGCYDWAGKYCPIVLIMGREVWYDGKRHINSLCRFSKIPQKLYNYTRSSMAERMGMGTKVPWKAANGSIEPRDAQAWQTSNNNPVGVLLYNSYDLAGRPLPEPHRADPIGVDPALSQESSITSDEIKETTGIYEGSLGMEGNETSGIAINARNRQAVMSTSDFTVGLSIGKTYSCKVINDLIPKIIDTARQIRIVGEDETETVIKVNQIYKDEAGKEVSNDLSDEEEYDLILTVGASYESKRQENSDRILELMKVAPSAAQLLPYMYVKSLDFDSSQEASDLLKKALPPGYAPESKDDKAPPPLPPEVTQQLQQAQQMGQQLQQMAEQMKAMEEQLKSKAVENKVAVGNLKISEYEAITKRLAIGQNNETKIKESIIDATSKRRHQMDNHLHEADMTILNHSISEAGRNIETQEPLAEMAEPQELENNERQTGAEDPGLNNVE